MKILFQDSKKNINFQNEASEHSIGIFLEGHRATEKVVPFNLQSGFPVTATQQTSILAVSFTKDPSRSFCVYDAACRVGENTLDPTWEISSNHSNYDPGTDTAIPDYNYDAMVWT